MCTRLIFVDYACSNVAITKQRQRCYSKVSVSSMLRLHRLLWRDDQRRFLLILRNDRLLRFGYVEVLPMAAGVEVTA